MACRDRLIAYLSIADKTDPIEWIEANISLRNDPTSASDAFVTLEPYQKRPILAQYRKEVREVTIMAPEQTGKSVCWRFPMLHKLVEYPGPAWIIYESDDKAEDINAEQFDPLLRALPAFAGKLNRFNAMKRRYMLPNGATLDFSGAGADITSKPKRDGVADELDTWPLTLANIRQNLRNFRKRFRTFWARGEGCLVKVSSPSPRRKGDTQDMTRSIIGEEFAESDGGHWTLRCQKCKRLTMPSHATYLLQWECEGEDEAKAVIPDSLRLDCPRCGHSHTEDMAQAMNDAGSYCTKDGTEITGYAKHVGCQWGAMATPRVFSWLMIADAQMSAGASSDIHAQANFFNSWRGLPYRPRAKEKAGAESLRKHCAPLPDPSVLANVFFAADTQDNGWYWIVRGVDSAGCLWLLGHGFARVITELKKAWDSEYLGILPVMGIIDEGGHGDMPVYARDLVTAEKGLYGYKGGSFGEKWRHGKVQKQILASARAYQADLCYYLYSQTDRTKMYWFLPPEETLEDEYISHLVAMQPNSRARHGDAFENWQATPKGAPDHYWDCEKQMLVLLDVAYKELKTWRKPVAGLRRQTQRKTRRAPVMEML